MTIRKGEPWGVPGSLPPDGVVVRSDAAARAAVASARSRGERPPVIGLLGGDLCRTLGGTGDEARLHGEAVVLPCDLGVAVLDGVAHCFVAHLAAHRGWFRGRTLVAMNAAWLGAWNLGPRAHPNDGLLDLLEADVRRRQRRHVVRRLPTGTHLPHPDLRAARSASTVWELPEPLPVHLDGEPVGVARRIEVRVEADALTVVV